jgi:hypothetical protein
MQRISLKWWLTVLMMGLFYLGNTQVGPPGGIRVDNQGRPMGNTQVAGGDSLKQRDSNEDSITIFYRMFDSSRIRFIDTTVSDFYNRFTLPMDYLYLNQLGGAARSVIFSPNQKPGYDPGFPCV